MLEAWLSICKERGGKNVPQLFVPGFDRRSEVLKESFLKMEAGSVFHLD